MITKFVGKVIKTMTVGMASSVFILFLDSMEALDDFPISLKVLNRVLSSRRSSPRHQVEQPSQKHYLNPVAGRECHH